MRRCDATVGRRPWHQSCSPTSQNAGSPGTQAAEYLVDEEPGDQELPPAVPKVAREAGIRQSAEEDA